jgi:hypothetical protein
MHPADRCSRAQVKVSESKRLEGMYDHDRFSVVLVGAAVLAYDDLILFERDRFPDEWTHDGMPTTLIRRSGRRGGITSTYAAASSCLRWTLFTPSWIRTDRQAAMLIRRIQILLSVWTFVLVPGLVFAFVSVMRDAK